MIRNKTYRLAFLLFLLMSVIACSSDEVTMEVMATAYNALPAQTDGDPTVAAWGDVLDLSIPSIAVSRDLIELGLVHDTKVRIDGFPGYYLVRDKIHKRFTKRIDIFMGLDLEAAKEFGIQPVLIRWDIVPDE